MDSRRSQTEHSRTMPPDWGFALGVLLRAGAGDRGKSRADATARRAVSAHSVLGCGEHDLVAEPAGLAGESQTCETPAAGDGAGSDLCQAAIIDSSARASHLSVLAPRRGDRSPGSLLGGRYNVYPAARRIRLSGGDHGLVQPIRAQLGGIGVDGDVVLPVGAGL